MDDYNKQFIQTAINNEIKKVTEEELEKAKERIDKRKAEIITGVILYVERQIKMETLGNELRITVKTVN